MSDLDDDIKKRSEKMIDLFNSFKNQELSNLPVPPFTKWANGKIIKSEYGLMELEFEVRPEMANPTNLLHGGIQCALMDDTIGAMTATLGYEGILIATGLNADYLGKAVPGEKVHVMARMVREGRYIVHAISEITKINGELVSKGSSNMLKTQFTPEFVKYLDNEGSKELKK